MIEDMRCYTTKPMNGGTTFKCTYCEHSVTTLDFNSTNGNRRMQAASGESARALIAFAGVGNILAHEGHSPC
jgi:hypothetical protein